MTVEYYLKNGGRVSYSYKHSDSALELLADCVQQYIESHSGPVDLSQLPKHIYVQTWLAHILYLEYSRLARYMPYSQSQLNHFNSETMNLYICGIEVWLHPVMDLRWPVFYGTADEYEDNAFRETLENALTNHEEH